MGKKIIIIVPKDYHEQFEKIKGKHLKFHSEEIRKVSAAGDGIVAVCKNCNMQYYRVTDRRCSKCGEELVIDRSPRRREL
jgi:hypothetical protein